jgi:hypothetical protein
MHVMDLLEELRSHLASSLLKVYTKDVLHGFLEVNSEESEMARMPDKQECIHAPSTLTPPMSLFISHVAPGKINAHAIIQVRGL